jgi:hypothetical protein
MLGLDCKFFFNTRPHQLEFNWSTTNSKITLKMHHVYSDPLTGELDFYVRTITDDETLVWPGNKYYYVYLILILYR